MAKMVNFTYIHFTTRKLIENIKKKKQNVLFPTPPPPTINGTQDCSLLSDSEALSVPRAVTRGADPHDGFQARQTSTLEQQGASNFL